MGPNGSGKSTLAYSIAGHPKYKVTGARVTPRRRGRARDDASTSGPAPGSSSPCSTPSRCPASRCRTSCAPPRPRSRRGAEAAHLGQGDATTAMDALAIDPSFAERNVNEGFSGGEKKRHEILQMELLKPKIAILDETDSGLDVDALRVVVRRRQPGAATGDVGVLLITHYTRILRYIKPDFVHVFVDGRIVERGRARAGRQARGRGLRAVRDGGRVVMTAPTASLTLGSGSPRSAPGPGCSTSSASGRTSRSCRAPCATGSRWSTSTPARPRRSRTRCSTPSGTSTPGTTPPCTAGAHQLAEEATDAYEGARDEDRRVHRRAGATRSCSPRTPPRP